MGLWRLAKWAKDKSEKPRKVPKMPSLTRDDQIASTFEEKTEMLKQKFFPPAPPADLSDIEGSFYPSPPHCPTIVTRSEVTESIRRLKPDTAPGPDGITNRIVKACSEKLSDLLTPLFQACIDQAYHPRAFKPANTITLRKIDKDDYTAPNAYRPIALLNTRGKVMESIMSKKITHIAETPTSTRYPDGCQKRKNNRNCTGTVNGTNPHSMGTRQRQSSHSVEHGRSRSL